MRRSFHEELEVLEDEVQGLADLVKAQLVAVLGALKNRDVEAAEEVIEGDNRIDQKYVEVEHRILGLLARQAPVAGDLRLISGILHINIHLERMGDLCVNMAKFVRITREYSENTTIAENLQEMGERALEMMDASLKCFHDRDLEAAQHLPQLDEPIDKMNKRVFREIAASASDESMLDWASRMALVSRYIERIGDHCVDIGEQVGFILTGEILQFDI